MEYNVAFRKTSKTGGFQGIITWMSFSSKNDFEKWYTDEIREQNEVVEEGITEERAVELTKTTPIKCWIAAAKQKATQPDGTINTFILEMEMVAVRFMAQEAVKRGYENAVSEEEMWENGWILPNGEFVNCSNTQHIYCAENKLGKSEEELEKTAVKVSCAPVFMRLEYDDYRPVFLTQRERMTEAQLKTIEKYCVKYGCRPPLDYFIQQDLHDMAKMSTEDILSILKN
ncbi:MAG: hypothetical protein PHZ25_02770 [Candidatus Pacebacteria bacterium]|nr:hypothetical protein [Candidatus Paceibacterota bacterium]